MLTYLFHLGRQPKISIAEIESVFSLWKIPFTVLESKKALYQVETKKDIDTVALMNRLGGTLKIQTSPKEQNITDYLLDAVPDGKIQFSLSGNNARQIALQTKKELKDQERSVRYIEPKNTATILHNNLVERQTDLTLHEKQLFITVAIQPIEELGKRDFGRPGFDAKSGMLPPKLAKIMINLAEAQEDDVLLDPYCGSGTVLMEAALMGYGNLIGSDTSPKAIEDTKKNLEWIQKDYGLQAMDYRLLESDVRDIDKKLGEKSVGSIISEPYMGVPLRGNDSESFLEKQVEELKRLYTSAFTSFHKILKSNGTVVMIIPKFRFRDEWMTIGCLDKIKELGFNILPLTEDSPSLLYHREGQHVGREIWKFRKR
ncbi:MAG: DNA methyltransferase [Candidatus Magasanikbacteria bacterium]